MRRLPRFDVEGALAWARARHSGLSQVSQKSQAAPEPAWSGGEESEDAQLACEVCPKVSSPKPRPDTFEIGHSFDNK